MLKQETKPIESGTTQSAPPFGLSEWTRSAPLFLSAISAVALLTRLWYTYGQSVTFDEYYEVDLATKTLQEIAYRGDGFPPLYSICVHYWQTFFGSNAGIASARSLSILFGVACCPAIYFTARRAVSKQIGLIAAGLISILPIHMFYTSEARAYSLLLLITCLATNAALAAIENENGKSFDLKNWLVFSFFAAMGLYTHYLFAAYVGVVLLVGLLQNRDIGAVVAGGFTLSMIVPLLMYWSRDDFNMQQGWTYQMPFGLGELCYTYASFVLGYTAGPSTRELHPMHFKDAVLSIGPWAIIVLSSILTLLLTARHRLPRKSSTPLLLALLLTPAFTGMACMTFEVGYQVRYVVWAVIPAIILLSFLIAEANSNRWGRIATGALVLVMIAAGTNRSAFDRYRNADIQSAASFFRSDAAPTQPIVIVSGYMVEPFKYYLNPTEWKLTGIPMQSDYTNRESEFDTLIEKHVLSNDVVWFVYTREFHEDPDGLLFQRMEQAADLELVKDLAGLKIYRATVKHPQS